jgi:hypothetical protein
MHINLMPSQSADGNGGAYHTSFIRALTGALIFFATPALSQGQAVPAPQLSSPDYVLGQADRAEWERWIASLSGASQAGAIYWAVQRSTTRPGSCNDPQQTPDWQRACAEARRRLSLPDALRRSELQYRNGWNGPVQPQTGARPQDQAQSPQPSAEKPQPPNPLPSLSSAPSPRLPQNDAACGPDWRRCTDNAHLVRTSLAWTRVQDACRIAAGNIARAARLGFSQISFGSFNRGDDYPRTGIVVAIEPRAQLRQAAETMRVVCKYDLNRDEVLDLQMEVNY